MKLRIKENDDVNITNYRVDVYNPQDFQALIKREYVPADSADEARQKVFNELPDNLKSKWNIKDTHSFEVMRVK